MSPTKEQMQDLLKDRFGDVEIVCENPVIHGEASMASFGIAASLLVYADEHGKKFAVQVPFGVGLLPAEEAA